MSGAAARCDNAAVVAQCPNCQSKFRIADEKVTDRGVRVRCTTCKNVFQVKKPAVALEVRSTPQAAAIGIVDTQQPQPMPIQRRSSLAAANGARRFEPDDLFGMAELTGESAALPGSPLSTPLPSLLRAPAQPPLAPPVSHSSSRRSGSARRAVSSVNFDDIDIEVGDQNAPGAGRSRRAEVSAAPPLRQATPQSREPAAGTAQHSSSLPPPPPDEEGDGFATDDGRNPEDTDSKGSVAAEAVDDDSGASVRLGAFKTTLKDPFEGVDLGSESGGSSVELSSAKPSSVRRAAAAAEPVHAKESAPESPRSSGSEIVSSALTGLVGAALAIAVLLAVAVSANGGEAFQLLIGGGDAVVATRLVSGLYDTAAGQPIFFVRGRVENRSKRPRGPVRVIAELVNDNGADGHAETLAGFEPSPEDVYSLRTAADAQKLVRALAQNGGDRKIPAGGSLPFFALIRDPPRDLEHHKLTVRLEAVDAWAPPLQTAQGSR